MESKVQDSVLISQPVDLIFAFLSVAENHASFIPGMLNFEQVSPGSFTQPGAQARGLRRFLGGRLEVPYEITEVEPNLRLSMKGAMGPITFEDGYALEARGDSTLVTFWLRPTLTGLAKLALPFVMLVGKTHAAETLSGLKNALEARPVYEHVDAR